MKQKISIGLKRNEKKHFHEFDKITWNWVKIDKTVSQIHIILLKNIYLAQRKKNMGNDI